MKDIVFPKWLESKQSIGVTATSDGVNDELDQKRFMNAKIKLKQSGHDVIFTDNVFKSDEKSRSSIGKERGREFNELVDNKNVGAIIAAKGGNFLNEMLPYVDYEKFLKNPKWVQGYSDNTGLIHTLTTKYNIAAIYGSNFGDFGMECWHESVQNNLDLLEGKEVVQKSFDFYQDGFAERKTGLEGYVEDSKVEWKIANNQRKNVDKSSDSVEFCGRLLGGCLDVLVFLQGTKYDGTLSFIEKYKQDGIIWYLESFDISGENLMMFLWQLSLIGWFKYTKGIMFGRPLFYKEYTNTPYEEAVLYGLSHLNVPIILDADFGHKGPRMTLINGAKACVTCQNGHGCIRYIR